MNNIVELKENELVISHKVIAEQTENNQISVRKLIDKHIDSFKQFGKLSFEMTPIKNSKNKINNEKTYYLNEQQATLLLTFMRNNQIIITFKIRLVKEFFEMREILNSQTSNQPQPDQNIVNNIFALNNTIQILRPSEASKILMTEKLYKKLKLETNYLPKYTEEKLTRSLTYLLKKYEINLSTQKANVKLLELGILEKVERDSSCGNKKYFYSITENGLKYGKNLISPKNERETQPHFYESKFLELTKLLWND
jgi:phage regulator Rha-like protein